MKKNMQVALINSTGHIQLILLRTKGVSESRIGLGCSNKIAVTRLYLDHHAALDIADRIQEGDNPHISEYVTDPEHLAMIERKILKLTGEVLNV